MSARSPDFHDTFTVRLPIRAEGGGTIRAVNTEMEGVQR